MRVTLFEIVRDHYRTDKGGIQKITKPGKQASVVEKMTAQPLPKMKAGHVYTLTPGQLLNVHVNRFATTPNGDAEGYQRDLLVRHTAMYAADMEKGDVFPAATGALNPDGTIDLVDGQQRSGAAIFAGKSLRVEVISLTDQQRARFYDKSGDMAKLKEEDRALRRDGKLYDFLRAGTVDPYHPWFDLIDRKHKNLNATQSVWVLAAWTLKRPINSKHQSVARVFPKEYEAGFPTFTHALGAELATLLKTWGTGVDHIALGSHQSKATVSVAIKVLEKNPHFKKSTALLRWNDKMRGFDWEQTMYTYRATRGSNDSRALEGPLLDHWNKGLSWERRSN